MKYAPFGLQHNDEQTFGRLNATRNMAIYGVSPAMMDYSRTAVDGIFSEQDPLWDQLFNLNGIH